MGGVQADLDVLRAVVAQVVLAADDERSLRMVAVLLLVLLRVLVARLGRLLAEQKIPPFTQTRIIDTRSHSPAEQLEAAVTRLGQVAAVDYLREARAHRRFAHVAGGDAHRQVAVAAQLVCRESGERYQSNFAPDFDANESRREWKAEPGTAVSSAHRGHGKPSARLFQPVSGCTNCGHA